MFFFSKKLGGRCGCVYGTKGAVDRKSLGTTGLDHKLSFQPQVVPHTDTQNTVRATYRKCVLILSVRFFCPGLSKTGMRHILIKILKYEITRNSDPWETR
jgi:hypothetical protein